MGRETVLGMVLSTSPIGESDKRLVLLTREKGKISAFARGASKPNSPLLGCSQTFAFGEFAIYAGRNSYTLAEGKVDNYFAELRDDLEKLYYAFYFCELAEYVTRENLDAAQMLKLLYQSLGALVKGILANELVRYIYEWRQMVVNGEAYNASFCQICKAKDGLAVFSKRRHGLLCANCSEDEPSQGDVPVLAATAYTLNYMAAAPFKDLFAFNVTERVRKELGTCVRLAMEGQWNHGFHSLKQLEETLAIIRSK